MKYQKENKAMGKYGCAMIALFSAVVAYPILFGAGEAHAQSGGTIVEDHAYVLTVDGNQYVIRYIGREITIQNMTVDKDTNSIMMTLNPVPEDGLLQIALPRNVIDARSADNSTAEFVVLVDGSPANFSEVEGSQNARVLDIPVQTDSNEITIRGTKVIPEFGSVVTIVIAALGMTGIILVTNNMAKRWRSTPTT
jgi:hypothetical protein